MDSRERAHEWVMDHEQTPYREDIDSLARLLDAHAAERVREALHNARMEILSECMNVLGATHRDVDHYNAGVSHCARVLKKLEGVQWVAGGWIRVK